MHTHARVCVRVRVLARARARASTEVRENAQDERVGTVPVLTSPVKWSKNGAEKPTHCVALWARGGAPSAGSAGHCTARFTQKRVVTALLGS